MSTTAHHFSTVHRVQFSETDTAGVVHFSNFYKWMEEVEHAYFRSVGLSVQIQREGLHIGWPRVSASCEFEAPARFEDEIELRFHVIKLGGKSMSYEVRFFVAGRQIALGKVTSVCCEITPDGLKAISIPADIRRQLTPVAGI